MTIHAASPRPDDTPILTDHARQRCAEMGISTKVAKRIWQHRDLTFPGAKTSWGQTAMIVFSDLEPRYMIVVPSADFGKPRPRVVTVAFRTTSRYIRNGPDFIPIPDEGVGEGLT